MSYSHRILHSHVFLAQAFEGNVLECLNMVLNPFDESYIDRDLSRTGLCMTIITPGSGHFAVAKDLLRLTTERVIDHGVCLDLVSLSQIPLHTTPLFSYWSQPPEQAITSTYRQGEKVRSQDPLYLDPQTRDSSKEVLCYCAYANLPPLVLMLTAQLFSHAILGLRLVLFPLPRSPSSPRPLRPSSKDVRSSNDGDYGSRLDYVGFAHAS